MSPPARPEDALADEIRVLHVDDDPALADLTATALGEASDRLRVETATSAEAGLDRLAADRVDCVVSDYEMPAMNGIEFLEAVRAEHPDLPFILFTGKGSEEIASDAISAGVTDYLQKETGTGQYAVLANRIENVVTQHRSRRALERSEERLTRFIEQSPLGVIEWDESFTVERVNDAAAEIFGYDPADLVGASWERFVPPESYDAVDRVTDELLENRGGYHSIDENVRRDGERITCEWHNHVVTADDGAVVAIFSQVQDITERREREERFERTTARLEALFENSPDMINTHDTAGNILDPNPKLCEKTGYSAAELRDTKVWEIDAELDPETARENWADMDVGDQLRMESTYRRRDGSTFPVEVHIRRLNVEGEDRFVVISRDISEHEERTRELELKERAMDAAPIGITISDATQPDNPIIYANDGFHRQTGYDKSAVVGRNCRFLQGDDTDPEPVAEMREAIDAAEPVTVELRNYRPDGTMFWNQVTIAPIRDDAGEVRNFVGFQQDVTERVEQERELERQNERLEQFANVVSHDLRNPLNVAQGRLAIARGEGDDEHLAAVATAHDRMEALVDDLLTLARQGRPIDERSTVSLASMAEDCWDVVETTGATLRVEGDVRFQADEDRLRQLLENLVRNSVEHGSTSNRDAARRDDSVEHGGEGVTITVGALDDASGFFVADDGEGIPPAERDRIFESGYSTAPDGTGFGLAIVAEIADAHGWTIEAVESEDGGARFEIRDVEA